MDVAGGLYHEICDVPHWRAVRGSGGRAAAVLSRLTATRLHCYASPSEDRGVDELRRLGVNVAPHSTRKGIAFAYFHTLSKPHIEPPLAAIEPANAFEVEGNTILRFGMLEGDAIIRAAACAVYDPQTYRDPPPFAVNGSQADRWALIANVIELQAIGRSEDLGEAARTVFREQGAELVVAKRGPHGASIFSRTGKEWFVPAYRSDRVFKIGTGDVFSALFAFHWGYAGLAPPDAADRASRGVSAYCEDPTGEVAAVSDRAPVPVGGPIAGPVLLLGRTNTLGQRYTLEEARFRLRELGAHVHCPALDGQNNGDEEVAALLIVADGATSDDYRRADRMGGRGTPVVLLASSATDAAFSIRPEVQVTDDFSSAIYGAVWAACTVPNLSPKVG